MKEIVTAVTILITAAMARGGVHVRRICFNASGTVSSNVIVMDRAAGEIIEIDPASFSPNCGGDGGASFRIFADNAAEDIGVVRFVGVGGNLINDVLLVGDNSVAVSGISDLGATGRDWAGLEPGPYQFQVQANIGRNITGPVTADCVVRIRAGGSIGPAADITQTGASNKVWAVTANGDIAGDVTAGSLIAGNDIDRVRSDNGNITGAIAALHGNVFLVSAVNGFLSGPITSNRGQISLITARTITSHIIADGTGQVYDGYYAIRQIIASEDIGTSDQRAVIETRAGAFSNLSPVASDRNHFGYANGGIYSVQARRIYADITTPVPPSPLSQYSPDNTRGDIREVKVLGAAGVAGTFEGTITTFTLGDTSASAPLRAMDLAGDLNGNVVLGGTIKNPVRIGGSIPANRSISLTDQDLLATGDITVVGTLAGRIDIGGSEFGDLVINPGSMPGTVRVMGDLGTGSRLTVSGPMSGSVEVGRDLLGQLSLTGSPVTGHITVGRNICSPTAATCALLSVSGNFASAARIDVGGSVYAIVTVPESSAFHAITFTGAFPVAGTIKIADSLRGGIVLPPPSAGGLSGQVIINGANGTGIFGSDARVRIGALGSPGQLNIPTPYYTTPLAAQIGGGAVGVAPFRLHADDCVPPYANPPAISLLTSSFLASRPAGAPEGRVTIRSYGPMRIAPGYNASNALRVEFQNPSNCFDWQSASQFFTVTMFPGGDKRVIELTRVSQSVPYPAVYRVVPEGLVCDDVANNDVPLAWPTDYVGAGDFPEPAYVFAVGADCGGPVNDPLLGSPPNGILDYLDIIGNPNASPAVPACSGCDTNGNWVLDWCEMAPGTTCRCDWYGNGIVSVQDLFDFLQCWFAGTGDFNLNGQNTVQDIFDFLNCFFTLPAPCHR